MIFVFVPDESIPVKLLQAQKFSRRKRQQHYAQNGIETYCAPGHPKERQSPISVNCGFAPARGIGSIEQSTV